jgi:hypothetical protein
LFFGFLLKAYGNNYVDEVLIVNNYEERKRTKDTQIVFE